MKYVCMYKPKMENTTKGIKMKELNMESIATVSGGYHQNAGVIRELQITKTPWGCVIVRGGADLVDYDANGNKNYDRYFKTMNAMLAEKGWA